MEKLIFYMLAAVILIFSVLTVTSRKILRAAVYLLFVLAATAGFYFFIEYNFLAAVQLTVYSGGIVVLIVFAVLLTAHLDHKLEPIRLGRGILSGILVLAGAGVSIYAIKSYSFIPSDAAPIDHGIEAIGLRLLSYGDYGYVLPFEVISILLVAAMVAAIVIAKRSISND
jgi:NADH-quinone oxidoreductase subunit J